MGFLRGFRGRASTGRSGVSGKGKQLMSKFKVVVTDLGYPTYEHEKKVLEPVGAKLTLATCQTEEEVIKACRTADGVLLRSAPMTAHVIDTLEKCRVIARYGVGVDNVDLKAATAMAAELAGVFPEFSVALLHGRMSGEEKDTVMRGFAVPLAKPSTSRS